MLQNMYELPCDDPLQNGRINPQAIVKTSLRTVNDTMVEGKSFKMEQGINQMFMGYEVMSNQNQPIFIQPYLQHNSSNFEVGIHTVMNPIVQPSHVYKEEQADDFLSNLTQTKKSNRGRKPARPLSEEEERKQATRRERNKLAAARCRKKRLDQTNQLIQENERLESEGNSLKLRLKELQNERKKLQTFIASHSPCVFKNVMETQKQPFSSELNTFTIAENKEEVRNIISRNIGNTRQRPTSLPIQTHLPGPVNISRFIPTPQGKTFNFESLMEGGTGLTPISTPLLPSMIIPQRNHDGIDLRNSRKYVSL